MDHALDWPRPAGAAPVCIPSLSSDDCLCIDLLVEAISLHVWDYRNGMILDQDRMQDMEIVTTAAARLTDSLSFDVCRV